MDKNIKILIACEESQAITIEFRKLWFEAYSCDLQDCSWWHPEWHIKGDAIKEAYSWKYDLMIAHPPCTYLSVAWAWAMYKKDWSINEERLKNQNNAIDFFMKLINAPIEMIAVENPVCIMSSKYRKPDQIIHPYYFWDKASKQTCLWLKNLPLLEKTDVVEKWEFKEWIDKKTWKKKRQAVWIFDALSKWKTRSEVQKLRSKTFPGIAKAIARQWWAFLQNKN